MPILKQVGFVDDAGNIYLTRSEAARHNLRANTKHLAFFTMPSPDGQLEELIAALATWRAERDEKENDHG